MEGTLKFNLPEDGEEFKYAVNAVQWAMIAHEIDNYLRSKIKYDDSISECAMEVYEEIRRELRDMITSRGLEV